ncbi:sigma-54 interaction domain-containing protein [Vibrio rarus]|uniref:sigma-54 interaction domain-containing protein n=1 Tax=Vibrio rarus TaxID=413403 RepID=UPI0021C28E6F|nr:sigma 54-interacting transcriptional regulator [Vibrio rarus]
MDKNYFYRHAIEALTGSLNIEEGLAQCASFLKTVMPCDVISVHLWDESLCSLRIYATADANSGQFCNILIPIPEDERYITRWEHAQSTKIINDAESDPVSALVEQHLQPIYGAQTYSHMITRVTVSEQRICDIALLSRGRGRFIAKNAQWFAALNSPFGIAVSNSIKHKTLLLMHDKLLNENRQLKHQVIDNHAIKVIGEHGGLKFVMSRVEEVSETSAPVLILGETGVGKDVIASLIQQRSQRSDQPFIKVNCGAIPEELLDSELFGHEKGSFTGAIKQSAGRFERAHNGTIFLDEVGELSKGAQVRLLRVLQNGELERVGGSETIQVNVRVIAATNESLEEMVEDGRFRRDLYYRLCVFPILIPPLRDRLDDIPLFVDFFVYQNCRKLNLPPMTLAVGEIERLQQHRWAGNIRELSNVVERSVIRCRGSELRFHLPEKTRKEQQALTPISRQVLPVETTLATLEEVNRQHIIKVLELCNGRIQGANGAAEALDINPHTLRSRMKKLGIVISSSTNITVNSG